MAENGGADRTIVNHFLALGDGASPGVISAEYIWIGGTMGPADLRSKTKTLSKAPESVADLPDWNFDGSSTNQAPGNDSEVILKPRAIFKDPFRGGDNILVLCDCYKPDGTPLPSNTRYACNEVMESVKDLEPWFGIEQEYSLLNAFTTRPLNWPQNGFLAPQGPYYCGVGAGNAIGRDVVECHMKACKYAGIKISGINAEVMPSQWEFQIGPCTGIEEGDHLWMARYLLLRVGEMFHVGVTFEPKIISGDWNGAGCHTNFSTKPMREDGGYDVIVKAVEKLGERHEEHIAAYGAGNAERLTGAHETCSISEFKYGVADRGSSVRIPSETFKQKKGYFEDRRPAANIDPYVVTRMIVESCCL